MAKIVVKNLWWKYFGSKDWALKDVSFKVEEGEVLGIVGPSGAGKTTLCLALNGLIPHHFRGQFKGQVLIDGMDTVSTNIGKLVSKIGMVFQDPETQLVTMSVWDEIAFTLENFGVPPDEIKERVEEALDLVGLSGLEEKHPLELSAGQKQRLAIASALAIKPEILILDEPTSNLDPIGRVEVFSTLRKLKREGYTIIIVEHETDELAKLVDKLLILYNGEVISFDDAKKLWVDVEKLKRYGVAPPQVVEFFYLLRKTMGNFDSGEVPLFLNDGIKVLNRIIRDLNNGIEKIHYKDNIKNNLNKQMEKAIEIKGLHYWYPDGTHALRGIDLQINSGEFVAIVGKNGSGKTTLAKIISGILKPSKGEVKIFGRDVKRINRRELVTLVGYSFQNPDHQLFCDSVREELEFGPRNINLPKEEIDKRVKEVSKMLGLEKYLDEPPFFLSKGLRLRIAVGAILTMKPNIIIVDEPTIGQDWRQSEELMQLLKKLNHEGKTIIFLTHHMRYVAEYAKRVIIMESGKIILDNETRNAFKEINVLKMANVEPPPITILGLKTLNIPMLTVEEGVEIVKGIVRKK